MGRTIAEKVLSDRSGSDARAGDIVKAEVDYVMVNDVTGPIAFREFAKLGTEHPELLRGGPQRGLPSAHGGGGVRRSRQADRRRRLP